MTVQDSVLQILANEANQSVSGEAIAEELGVSRAAVWKAIQKLQDAGYQILGTRNKGYLLDGDCDPLTERGLGNLLAGPLADFLQIKVVSATGSTNNDLRAMAEQGANPFTCIVAGEQTAGKGRRGRKFFSLGDSGVYLSMLLKPSSDLSDAGMITGAAAVAVCRAIKSTLNLDPSIKWVNDVYVGKKKVCGILTEGVADLETGMLAYAIVGIGINVYEPNGGFPDEIASRAGCLSHTNIPNLRNRIASEVIKHCYGIYSEGNYSQAVSEYRKYSMMKGLPITVHKPNGDVLKANSLGINDDLSLRVRYENDSEEDLRSGEVSISL